MDDSPKHPTTGAKQAEERISKLGKEACKIIETEHQKEHEEK